MGKRNRERRRAEQARRERAAAPPGASGRTDALRAGRRPVDRRQDRRPTADDVFSVLQRSVVAPSGRERTDPATFALLAEDLGPEGRSAVGSRVDDWVGSCLDGVWEVGWQPDDVVAIAGRRLGADGEAVASGHVVRTLRDGAPARAAGAMPETWAAQVERLASTVPPAGGRRRGASTAVLVGVEAAESSASWAAAVDLVRLLVRLPAIEVLLPRPSEWGTAAVVGAAGAGIDPKVLGRVRGLLAKAESTTFPEEAEALTAKAQELMARHAVDHLLVAAGGTEDGEAPVGRRLWVDSPYADAKSMLVHHVAEANRCRSVFAPGLGFATVFGFAADLEAVELLFTSLLVQATRAVVATGDGSPGGSRSRSRSFRQSFWVSYANRIGQRLRAADESAVSAAAADADVDLLPVLASRRARVDDAVQEAFPRTATRSVSASDAAGWAAGAAAADRADLDARRPLPG